MSYIIIIIKTQLHVNSLPLTYHRRDMKTRVSNTERSQFKLEFKQGAAF